MAKNYGKKLWNEKIEKKAILNIYKNLKKKKKTKQEIQKKVFVMSFFLKKIIP